MVSLLNGVAQLQSSTGLSHLSDGELIEYANLVADLNRRDINIHEQGIDTKAMYHVVRLISEVEQILIEGDLDLERNREQLKSIRRGEWTLPQIEQWFQDKERDLESVYLSSSLPHGPDEGKIKTLLLECLEMHYGDLSTAINREVNVDALPTRARVPRP